VDAKYVELIAVVAEAGSLGAAAQRLGKSQPAVSKALQAAEAHIGCQLFQRSSAGVVPTHEGQRVVDRCQSIRRDLTLLSEDIAQVRGDVSGTLNVVVSPLTAVRLLPEVLSRYLRR
jgi:DNA-binding transcriptional LysR family regulator